LYSGPKAKGTFTIEQIQKLLEDAKKVGTVEWIFFEGGEPFLYYSLLLEGIQIAKKMGFQVGIVTNAYPLTTKEKAERWLNPLAELNIDSLSISDDTFHFGKKRNTPSKIALKTAEKLGIPTSTICIQKPFIEAKPGEGLDKGEPVIGGGAMFKGRAVETLTQELPQRRSETLIECPHEDLQSPSRVHIDSYGYVQICQGISIGNIWEKSLSELVADYEVNSHPICEPLNKNGPFQLASQYKINHESEYVDECHFCYLIRRDLLDRFPKHLAPKQVYGY